MSTLPAHHPISPVTDADLRHFAHLVPPSGVAVIRVLGVEAGLKLINGLAGVQVLVPKGPCNNPGGARVWAYLAGVIGLEAMQVLANEMGGECLEVPTLDALRKERRNQAIRNQFDRLTARAPAGEGLSKARAVQELGLTHAPITWRQLETILDRPSLEPVCQNNLF
jgi:hypothetical protein